MYVQINAWILLRRYAPRQDGVFTLFNELVGHDTRAKSILSHHSSWNGTDTRAQRADVSSGRELLACCEHWFSPAFGRH